MGSLATEPAKTASPETLKKVQNFYRTTEVQSKPEEVKLKGSIPSWVVGDYYRTGPGVYDFGDNFTMNHFFDGYAVISKFAIGNGKVVFKKNILESDAYRRAMDSGKPCINEYGTRGYTDPSKGFFSRMLNTIVPEFTDNANVGLYNIGQCVFVCGETCYFHCLNTKAVQTETRFDSNKLFGLHSTSPHPITDHNGITYNIGSCYAPSLKYSIIKIPAAGKKDSKEIFKKSKIIGSLPTRWNRNIISYYHSFGITENYIVFIEQPYCISLNKILSSVLSTKGQPFKEWAEWLPEGKNRFHVLDKKNGKTVCRNEYYSNDSFFVMHIINCYEDKGQVVVTLSSYPDPTIFETQYLHKLRAGGTDCEGTRANGSQYVIPLDVDVTKENPSKDENLVKICDSEAKAYYAGSNQVILHPEVLSEKGMEFPNINKKRLGRKYRYYYASGLTSSGQYKNTVGKVDIKTRTTKTWTGEPDNAFGEPVFINNPAVDYDDPEQEDNGILLVPATDFRPDSSDLIVFLNPKDMTEIARAEFETQITPSIHGLYVPSS